MRLLEELAMIEPGTSMKELILQMNETGHGLAILITEDRSVISVISDSDLRRNVENLFDQDPNTIATTDPISVSPSDLIGLAMNKMEANRVYSILVVENKKPIGLLRMHDLLRAGVA